MINLFPKEGDRLSFLVGPVVSPRKPSEIFAQFARESQKEFLEPESIHGLDQIIDTPVAIPRSTLRDALNEIIREQPGSTWGFAEALSFSHHESGSSVEVDLSYPPLQKSTEKSINPNFNYGIVEENVGGVMTVTLKKRVLQKH